MLAVQARAFNNYFYLQDNNTNHPARFVPNKVTGILFENKVDHASMSSWAYLTSLFRYSPYPLRYIRN